MEYLREESIVKNRDFLEKKETLDLNFFSSLYEELNLLFWLKVNEALIHHYCEIFLML